MTQTILHIDSSARFDGSNTRQLSAAIVDKFGGTVIRRDLTEAIPQIDEAWVNANFTPVDQRSQAQRDALALSDTLVEEVKAADVIVIGVPVYNFGVPAALKAWVDQIARAGLTFQYTENGPVGLLHGKRAVIALATGGTPVGSEIDFASGYLRHIMGFIGITDVEIIAADRVMADAEKAMADATAQVAALAA
ncbi:FMN-dependent NADH-azoreductase [Roseobacter sinensis]|uniref:FMN dependent NADH:quinone oxidoreductase n=1 Tax=Roseobacter sinensis TaxID=2931391 RepID=A0ABT3BDY2_9RHOB|nr:NAD(P)H-dependent oxidoreductase [Roseobacter sp. WL0113]MCV3271788.1 NAD(P)H-dependent oxidoreductase [Roseobacter sp. WL0113]